MSHSYKNRVDAVILGRDCDPHYVSAAGVQVYGLSDDSQGDGPYISSWTPPDASYGAQPTSAEIAAVSEAAADAAQEADQTATAQTLLTTDVVSASIVEVLSGVAGEDVTNQVLTAIKAKL